MLRQTLSLLARSSQVKHAVTTLPGTGSLVHRFVPGEDLSAVVQAAGRLLDSGRLVTVDFLGEDTSDTEHAERTVEAYVSLLAALARAGLARRAEVSLKLSAIGQALPQGQRLTLENARRVCRAARNAGTTVTLDAEDHTTTDRTLATLRDLRKDFPETGAVLQAYLRRTEHDCRALAFEGSRVRLCKGAYDEPDAVAFTDRHEVDRSYVRCLKVLMAGNGYPMVATHDPRMIAIASALATQHGRSPDTFEFQMLYGVRDEEQKRLAERGHQVRVYVPYGEEWYGYLMRRLAERPANLRFFLRSVVSQR